MSEPAAPKVDRGKMADLGPRVASGVVMIVAALATAWFGGHVFTIFWVLLAYAVHWEWQTLIGGDNRLPRLAAGAAAVAAAGILSFGAAPDLGALAILAAALVCAALAGRARAGWAAAGVVYAGAVAVAPNLLRGSFPFGFEAIVWLFAVVWGTDIMAYFGGRAIGGPKLWPAVSPSKTWAGFLVGVSCGALAGLAVIPRNAPIPPMMLLGIAAGILAQGGDLLESSIKRRFGVKDSSRLIPGHGGVMDRLDGFLAAAAAAALLGLARAGYASPAAGLFNW